MNKQLNLFDREILAAKENHRLSKRKSPDGIATNNLIFSASVGYNRQLFPDILELYVAPGSLVADVTYGRGIFWKDVVENSYQILKSDIQPNPPDVDKLILADCRSLPYSNSTLDAVVFDPPYMHTPGGTAHVNHQNYETYYQNNASVSRDSVKYHEAVLALYFEAAKEAHRVLKPKGIYIVKCQDEVCANKQRLTHVEIINELEGCGFITEDLFVLVRVGKPGVSRIKKQLHARKNHSYFLVFKKASHQKSNSQKT